jgi:predicted transposase/invertase (TIGR01784 family)
MTFEMLMEKKFEAGVEKGIKQGREEGIAQGAYNTKLETAKKLLLKGMSPAEISEVTGLPLDTVLELKDQL